VRGVPTILPLCNQAQVQETKSRADALSRRHLLLFQLGAYVLRFEHLRGLYRDDKDFGELFEACLKHPKGDFHVQDGYLFREADYVLPSVGLENLF